MMQIKF